MYGFFNGEVSFGDVISDDDYDVIFEYVKVNMIFNWYVFGMNQMLLFEKGGVVDFWFKVYGIDGLCIVDCSIVFIFLDVNIVGLVFMIGEKGVEMICEDWGDVGCKNMMEYQIMC